MKQKPQDTLPGALALAVKQLKNLIVLNLLCILHALLIITAIAALLVTIAGAGALLYAPGERRSHCAGARIP